MDLAKAWLIALVVYLAGSVTTALVAAGSGTRGDTFTASDRTVLWSAVPALLIYLAMTLLTAITHASPRRDEPSRHVLAVLLPPALLIVLGAVYSVVQGISLLGNVTGAIAGVIGVGAGWWLAGKLRGRRDSPQPSDSYF